MRKARVKIHNQNAGVLEAREDGSYRFVYDEDYAGPAISLAMPIQQREYIYDSFPPFFDGVLPEGIQLEGLLKNRKLDRNNYFGQLLATGADLIGAVTVHEIQTDE